ncbi:phospholipid scramblase-related protein [Spirillospora sp. NPDC047279]|uniref:phospholipid scramblase-related protein n=1 Tax=Spirillospora sp. NPDC047279 TaxID=3155478 RepID=UPI0034094F54
MSDLFNSPVLKIDQPRGVPSAKSKYTVKDGQGTLLAQASEHDVGVARQAVRTVFGGGGRRSVLVENAHGVPVLAIETRSSRDTLISAPGGALYGSIQIDDYDWRYKLLDAAERFVGRLDGNRVARKFKVLDAAGHHVAQVDKKWKGAMTEILTSADRYRVEFHHPLPDPLRVLVVAAPIALDLMLYEDKDWIPG